MVGVSGKIPANTVRYANDIDGVILKLHGHSAIAKHRVTKLNGPD